MNRGIVQGCSLLGVWVLTIVAAAAGEQRIVLRSGTLMSGEARVDGENLIVTVDGADLTVPLKEVASVAPATNTGEMAQRLLLRSLELRSLYDGADNQIGLLAEAYRIAPDDPQVAYWYARALVDAGNAIAAKNVFEERKAAIVAAYPGIADRLAEQIEKRLKLKSLPEALVKRIDVIDAAARTGRNESDSRTLFAAYFRLVDQDDVPIEDAAMRINSRGERQNLETFPEGYHLLTYFGYRAGERMPCIINIDQLGLESVTFEFRGGADQVADAGLFRVRRLTEADQIPLVITVSDAEGTPLSDVTLAFSTRTELNRQRGVPPLVTDGKGRAEGRLLPGDYFCQVVRENYLALNKRIFVSASRQSPMELSFQLHRAGSAAATVVWRATTNVESASGLNEMTLTGEYELRVSPRGNIGYRGGRGGIEGIRLVQSEESMILQFLEARHDRRNNDDSGWIGRVRETAQQSSGGGSESGKTSLKRFSAIDVTKLNDIKSELDIPSPNLRESSSRGEPLIQPVELGAIYVGTIHGRDSQTGRPARYDFKLLVTEASDP